MGTLKGVPLRGLEGVGLRDIHLALPTISKIP